MKQPNAKTSNCLSGTKFDLKPSHSAKFNKPSEHLFKINKPKPKEKKWFSNKNAKPGQKNTANSVPNCISQPRVNNSKEMLSKELIKSDVKRDIKELPINLIKDQVIECVDNHAITIFIAETGTGKTTQIPQYMLETRYAQNFPQCCVAVTQPRRVAAISLATRVAKERKTKLGTEVGYSVRFDDKTSPSTQIKFITDGMLLRETLTDNLLTRYNVIILDEAHERSMQMDILFTLIKAIHETRAGTSMPLKLVLMSATMCVDKFSAYFGNAPVYYLQGRMNPVKVYNAIHPQQDYQAAALQTVFQLHEKEPDGDMLVFCTGQEEIEHMVSEVKEYSKRLPYRSKKLYALPLFSALPQEAQMSVFRPFPDFYSRKVIFSTNIGETSLTIPGIKYVIDTGKVKNRMYQPSSGIEILKVQNISKSQARQRAGRAGRDGCGVCYRLYTEEEYNSFDTYSTPEILRSNLANVLLHLSALKITNFKSFDFIDKPDEENIDKSAGYLECLGALVEVAKDEYELTDTGLNMSAFPLDPKYSKLIMIAKGKGCLYEILVIISFMYIQTIFYVQPHQKDEMTKIFRKFFSLHGDHVFLLKLYEAYRSVRGAREWCEAHLLHIRNMRVMTEVKKQLREICKKLKFEIVSAEDNTEVVRECLAKGLFLNIAVLQKQGHYKTKSTDQPLYIHPSSCLYQNKPDYVVFTELIQSSKCYMRQLSTLKLEWIEPLCLP